MISVASFAGLAGCALLPAAVMLWVKGVKRCSMTARYVIFGLLMGLAFLPVNGIPLAGYLRSLIGDVSITTLVLVFLFCISRLSGKDVYKPQSFLALMAVVAAAGVFLYPFALGLTSFDPYSLGYHSTLFAAFLFCVAFAAWYLGFYLVQFCIIFAVSGFLLNINESRNMWDYLIDPLIVMYALFWLPVTIIQKRRKDMIAHE
jgi:hypothetical protein